MTVTHADFKLHVGRRLCRNHVMQGFSLESICSYFLTIAVLLKMAVAVCDRDRDLDMCVARHGVDPSVKKLPYFINGTELGTFCSVKGELLDCFGESLADCSADYFYDFAAYNATFDFICQKENYTLSAYDSCLYQWLLVFPSCLTNYRSSVRALMKPVKVFGMCNIFMELRTCLKTTPTHYCTLGYAEFVNKVINRRLTPSLCGRRWNRYNFTTPAASKGVTYMHVTTRVVVCASIGTSLMFMGVL